MVKEDICLIIKAANQKHDDMKVDCKLSWSIYDLKHYLSRNYPSKPEINDQRIIYSGHLLKDNQLLKDIISSGNGDDDQDLDDHVQNTFIFHLVCPQKNLSKNETSVNSNSNNGTNTSSTTAVSNGISLDAFPNVGPNSASSSASPVWNQFNQMNTQIGPDNMLTSQAYQLLMHHYYQYMSYYLRSPPTIDAASYIAFANAYMQQSIVDQSQSQRESINATSNDNSNRVSQQPQPQQPRVAVAAPAAIINDDNQLIPMNRDWTDWLYTFSKLIIILSIIYFYSSLNRLILFITIFCIIYFYKNLLNGFHNNPNYGRNNNNPINDNNMNNDNNDSDSQTAQQAQPNDDDSRYSGLRFVWIFITSLFTSLIPDPVPIN